MSPHLPALMSRRRPAALLRGLLALLLLPLLTAAGDGAVTRPATRPATGPGAGDGGTPTVVYLVRHAEKSVTYRGPDEAWPLGDAGERRAEALRRELAEAGIEAIYVSDRLRTTQTAAPLAAALGLTPMSPADLGEADADERAAAPAAYPERLRRHLLAHYRGRAVLVVGHGNTVPAIIAALGVGEPVAIAEHEHDGLFVVTIPPAGRPELVRRRYGPHNPPA